MTSSEAKQNDYKYRHLEESWITVWEPGLSILSWSNLIFIPLRLFIHLRICQTFCVKKDHVSTQLKFIMQTDTKGKEQQHKSGFSGQKFHCHWKCSQVEVAGGEVPALGRSVCAPCCSPGCRQLGANTSCSKSPFSCVSHACCQHQGQFSLLYWQWVTITTLQTSEFSLTKSGIFPHEGLLCCRLTQGSSAQTDPMFSCLPMCYKDLPLK